MRNITDIIWREMNQRYRYLGSRIDSKKRVYTAEIANSVSRFNYADLPYNADGGLDFGSLVWVNNARKPGEGAGNGTGALCYFSPTANKWYLVRDDTEVVI